MRFERDDAKNRSNIAKHRISFETAKLAFEDPYALSVQDRAVEGEERWQTLGMIDGAVVILVAHTYRVENGEEVVRLISARKATPLERKVYETNYQSSK